MKYDAQLGELKNKLQESKRILIALPSNVNNDKMAGALALYLSLKQSGKEVAIVSEAEVRVSQSVFFGVGDIKRDLPEGNAGNFILGLEGVVENGKVPALVDLNWYPEGNTLNLVFNVVPGQKFEPINITHHYDTSNFDLIIIIGATNLAQIGGVYSKNLEKFADAAKVDIDNSNNNNLFGNVNIVDAGVPISEIVMNILQGLSLPQDPDIATNLITGIYDVTRGLTTNLTHNTFLTIGQAMQMGGKIIRNTGGGQPGQQQSAQGLDIKQVSGQQKRAAQDRSSGQSQNQPTKPQPADPQPASANVQNSVTSNDEQPQELAESQPTEQDIAQSSDVAQDPDPQQQKSQFEVPTGEQAASTSPENPAPDWLTPKIYKGGGLG